MKQLSILILLAGLMVPSRDARAQTTKIAPQPAATGNVDRGKDVYVRFSCYACHGYAGHGGAASRLIPTRLSLPAFTAFVRNPPSMPPYTAKVLSDSQLADVWAYVKSLPESPPAKSIPLLNQ